MGGRETYAPLLAIVKSLLVEAWQSNNIFSTAGISAFSFIQSGCQFLLALSKPCEEWAEIMVLDYFATTYVKVWVVLQLANCNWTNLRPFTLEPCINATVGRLPVNQRMTMHIISVGYGNGKFVLYTLCPEARSHAARLTPDSAHAASLVTAATPALTWNTSYDLTHK